VSKQVAIKVSVNGTKQAVKNIDELEKAVQELRNELKGVDIGSQKFKELSGELQNAESQLKTLNKSFEGLEPQKKADAFLKLGQGITGSFAIATAALTAFGVESEDVQQAQLAVTQALTAAIGFRQIAEAGLQAQVVATTISQKAYNLAAAAGNTITKAFFTTLALNPITAIVSAVALLAAGILALIKSQEKQIKIQDTLNKSVNNATKDSIAYRTQLNLLGGVINDINSSEEERQLALNELATILPELEGLELNNADAIERVNTAIQNNIRLSLAQARTEGLKQVIIQKSKEIFDQQNSSLEDNISSWERLRNGLVSGINPVYAQTLNIATSVSNSLQTQERLQRDLERATRQYEEALKDELKVQSDVDKARKQSATTQKELDNLTRQRTENVRRLSQQIKELGTALTFNYGEPKVLTDLRDISSRLRELSEGDLNFQEVLQRTFGLTLTQTGDVFGEVYEGFRKRLTDATKLTSDELGKVIGDITREAAQGVQSGDITIETFVALQALVDEYSNFSKLLNETPPIGDVLGDADYFNALRANLIQSGQVVFDVVDDNIELLNEKSKGYNEALISGRQQLIEAEGKIREELQRQFEKTYSQEDAKRLAEERVQAVTNLASAITTQEEQVRGVLFETQKVQREITEEGLQNLNTSNEAYKNFVLENLDLLTQYYDDAIEIDNNLFENEKLNRQQRRELEQTLLRLGLQDYKNYFLERKILADDLLTLEVQLQERGIFAEDLTAQERLKIIEEFYRKKQELRELDSQQEKEFNQEFFTSLAEGLEQISRVAQTGVQVFQQYLQTQLTLLEEEQKNTLSRIVGDSEEAEQKRTEIQEKFEDRRKELTKQAQIAQLELTRIQAIANVAEAVTKALASGPIIGQILAGVSAALGAVQVGIVTTQLAQVRNLRQGGLLSGPSHEGGGIPLGNTGVFAEGGEVVINRNSSTNYRELLSEINMAKGGRPIVSTSFDDTRLVEAISKQNREPIRAFVLESDITRNQEVNKRLQQLSKL
jgi:hypothetical protein